MDPVQTFSAKINYGSTLLNLTVYDSGPGCPSVVFIPGMGSHAGSYADLIPGANFLRGICSALRPVTCLPCDLTSCTGENQDLWHNIPLVSLTRAFF